MKKIIFVCLLAIGMTAFANTSPPDVDVGDTIEMIDNNDIVKTTVEVEATLHQNRLDAGFKTYSMEVVHDDNGAFLVIGYQFNDCLLTYCSRYLEKPSDIRNRMRSKPKMLDKRQKLKVPKIHTAMIEEVEYNYLI